MKEKSLKAKIASLNKELKEGVANIKKVTTLLEKISPKQRKMFNMIFRDFPDIDLSDSKRALQMIEQASNSIKGNNEKMTALLGEHLKEFTQKFPESENWLCDYSKEINEFLKVKTQETKLLVAKREEDKKMNELKSFVKVDKQDQVGCQIFDSYKDAEGYYKDEARDFFNCGQGYYEEEVETHCFIQDSFFSVKMTAEIYSAKQDVGDKLFWVESIKSIVVAPSDFQAYKQKQKDVRLEEIKRKEAELEALKKSV